MSGLRVYNDIIEAIEWSPLVRLNKVVPKDLDVEIWAKCEFMNPGGSVKDRIGRRMVEEAAREGRIKPNDILIEPTSGNTGIGMSLAAAVRGYQMIITMPKKMSFEKIAVLQALGAQIVRTRTEARFDEEDSHLSIAAKMNRELPNSHILDQYKNANNPDAHYFGTGAEIVQQMGGKLSAVVVGAGTGGTLTGIARRVKEECPGVHVHGVDPEGSILAPGSKPGVSYQVEGVGYDFVPDVLDLSLVDSWSKSNDRDSFRMARRLIREEGLLVGGSSGGNVHSAIELARTLPAKSRIVVVLPDSIRNYLTKFVDPRWMVENGIDEPTPVPALRAAPKQCEHCACAGAPQAAGRQIKDLSLAAPATVLPGAPVAEAARLIAESGSHGVVPVVGDDGMFAGVVTELSLLEYFAAKKGGVAKDAVAADFREAAKEWSLDRLHAALQRHSIAIVLEKTEKGKKFVGVVDRLMLLKEMSK